MFRKKVLAAVSRTNDGRRETDALDSMW